MLTCVLAKYHIEHVWKTGTSLFREILIGKFDESLNLRTIVLNTVDLQLVAD